MKTIVTLLFATVLVAFSQAPPIQRNAFTTNLQPAALDVVNGATGDRSVNLDLPEWRFRLNQGSNLTMLAFGDSTGLYTVSYLREPIFYRLGSNGFAAGQMANIHVAGAYTNLGTASSTNWPGAFYMIGADGTLGTNGFTGDGQIVVTNWGTANGGGIWSSVFQAAVERSPSSGTLMWQTRTNGGPWVNRYIFDANGAYGVITNELVLPLGWYNSRLLYSNSGPTKVLMMQQFDGTLTGRGARFYDMTYAGSRIEQLTNIATNVLGPTLKMMNPAVIWLEHRDSSNEYVNALGPVKFMLDTWVPRADVVVIGVGPKLTDDHELVGQNSVAREFCRTNRWVYLDMRVLRGYTNYFGVTNTYGIADDSGVHYPDAAWRTQSGSAFHRLPITHNEAANGAYNAGAPYLSPPEGSRHFDSQKATNNVTGNLGLNGILSMQNYLDVNSFIITRGSQAGVVIQDRLDSTDAARNWTLFNSDYTLEFYQNAYLFEMSGKFGIYRFSPYSTGSPYSRLGDVDHYWNHVYANGIQSTNQTNANLFLNLGNMGIRTNSPGSALDVAGTITAGAGSLSSPGYRFNTDADSGFIAPFAGGVDWVANGVASVRFQANGGVNLLNNSGSLGFGVITDAAISRHSAGTLSLQNNSYVNGTGSLLLSNLTANGAFAQAMRTHLAETNANAVTNILISAGGEAVVDLYATNHMSWTNFSGFTAGIAVRKTYRVTPTLIDRTNLWPTFGTPYSGVLVGTNEGTVMWTTFTNGNVYYVTVNSFGTNLIMTCSRFSN